jgi:hypothetical protein
MDFADKLFEASAKGDEQSVKELLRKGADPNAKDSSGWTPLHAAVAHGHVGVAKLLIENGSSVNAKTSSGWTPLHFASAFRIPVLVDFLIDKGADINAKDMNGETPLHFAASRGFLDVVELLLKRGADASIVNTSGKTPADLAEINGHHEVANFIRNRTKNISSESETVKKLSGVLKGRDVLGSELEIMEVSSYGVFRVGEWGKLRVALRGRGAVTLKLEGDVDYITEDSYTVNGEANAEIAVKPRTQGELPVKIIAESSRAKIYKLIWLRVESPRTCPKCGAPVKPGEKYCWRCGAKLS